MSRGRFSRPLHENYQKQSESNGGHWIWTGPINDKFYGVYQKDVNSKKVKAHNAVYEDLIGPIPEGLELDHKCKAKLCVNPDHLEPVTSAVNARRRGSTKLSMDKARRIRQYAAEGKNHREIAQGFGVSQPMISAIVRGEWWQEGKEA
jgi:hypothetical protein